MGTRLIVGTYLALLFVVASSGCSLKPTGGRLYFDNDVAGLLGEGTDRYYTNGVKIESSFRRDPERAGARGDGVVTGLKRALTWLRMFPDEDYYAAGRPYDYEQHVTVGIGQQIYTPEDIEDPAIIPDDRPYAGYLFAYAALHNLASEDGTSDGEERRETRRDRLDSVELQLGIIGPSSRADEFQTGVHDFLDATKPEGWDNQLRDEPVVQLSFTRQIRHGYEKDVVRRFFFLFPEYDVISNYAGRIGIVHVNAQVGASLRFGWNLPRDFAVDAVTPRINYGDRDQRWCYFFVGVDGRFVLRNAFLDGNWTKTSVHSVDSEAFVADFKLGISFKIGAWELGYTQYARTPEFRRTSDPQLFGAITAGLSF